MRNYSAKMLLWLALGLAVAQIAKSVELITASPESVQCNLQSSDPCEQVTELFCSSGVIDDGTGKSYRNEVGQDYENKIKKEMEVDAKEYWSQLFKTKPGVKSKIIKFCKNKGIISDFPDEILNCAVKHGIELSFEPSKNTTTDDDEFVFKQYFEHVYEKFKVPGLEQRIQALFDVTKQNMYEVVLGFGLNKDQEKEMFKRLDRVKFGGLCKPSADDLSRISSTFAPGGSYFGSDQKVYFCNADGRDNTSEFYLTYILAHEIAHSISPSAYYENNDEFPVESLMECLKSEKSMKARVGVLESNGTSVALDESVADYMTAEVLAKMMREKKLTRDQYIKGFANVMRFGDENCSSAVKKKKKGHPPIVDRLNKIILANPEVQNLLGCKAPPKAKYCGKLKTKKSTHN